MPNARRLVGILTFLAAIALPATCAATIPPVVVANTPGGALLRNLFQVHILNQALTAFWGIGGFAIFYYAVRMVYDAHKDESYSDMSNAVLNALIGFAVIACGAAFATALNTTGLSSDTLTDVQPMVLQQSIDSARQFIITLSTGVFVLMTVITALRMVSSKGEQGEFDKWRKVLVGSCLGVVVMFVANFIVLAVADRDAMLIVEELRGLALFALTVGGFLAVLALIVAGVLLIVSIDESLRDRAKKAVIGTLIALAIVICCAAIILTFVPGGSSTVLIS